MLQSRRQALAYPGVPSAEGALPPLSPSKLRTTTLIPTPDSVKASVVWALYWLLASQHAHLSVAHWGRCVELLARRRRALQDRHAEPERPGHHRPPAAIRAEFHAEWVVTALQAPRWRHAAGNDVTFPELLYLTACSCSPPDQSVVVPGASSARDGARHIRCPAFSGADAHAATNRPSTILAAFS